VNDRAQLVVIAIVEFGLIKATLLMVRSFLAVVPWQCAAAAG